MPIKRRTTCKLTKSSFANNSQSKTKTLTTLPHSRKESLQKPPDESLNRIARDFISVGSDFKHIFREHALLQLDLEDRNRIINAIEGVMSLSQEELKELLNLIKEEPGLHYQAHEKLLTFVMARWGTINPGKMLNHLAAWPDAQELL